MLVNGTNSSLKDPDWHKSLTKKKGSRICYQT